jgi:NAD(P)-dependent dehydrogenase (short-subunit alcohol dehydrogenase family)
VELAPFGIRVNSISPGPIETEFHDVVMPQRAATLGITKQEMIEKVRKSIPPGPVMSLRQLSFLHLNIVTGSQDKI